MSCITKIIDLLFLCRPVVLIPVWGFSIFGLWCGSGGQSIHDVTILWKKTCIVHFFHIFIFSLSVAAVYVLNQIADKEVDTINDGFALLVHVSYSKTVVWIFTGALALISIVVPIMSEFYFGALCALCALALGIIYSFKPCFFSGKPILDFLSNAVGWGIIAFAVGWVRAQLHVPVTAAVLIQSSPFFFLMCAGSISSTIPDIRGDKRVGKNTTAVLFGQTGAHSMASLCMLVALLCSYWLHNTIALLCTIGALPFYGFYYVDKSQKSIESTYKVGGALCMLCACIIFPALLLCAALVYLSTVLYFRMRHNIIYPSLIPIKKNSVHV